MGYLDFNFDLPDDQTFAPDPARVAAWVRLLPSEPFAFAPRVTERAAWEGWRATPFGRRIRERARELAAEPFPPYTNATYIDCLDRQDVTEINRGLTVTRQRQVAFLLAEAIHDAGEFLGPLAEDARRLAVLNAWIHPNNDLQRRNYHGETIENDLTSCHSAVHLLLARHVLGVRLPAEVNELIEREVERRLFAPLRTRLESGRDLYWWLTVKHNWNAVCLACYAQAAALLPQAEDRAWWLAAVTPLVQPFRDGFLDDGLCPEGTSYWSYGFSHLVSLAELLRLATGGVVDLLDDPKYRRIARYPDHAEVERGIFPSFSDCDARAQPLAWVRHWLENRCGATSAGTEPMPPTFDPFADMSMQFTDEPLLWMFRTVDPAAPRRRVFEPALRDWFADSGFLICRMPAGPARRFAATLLGGHNGVNHNHNDLGTFTVVLDGQPLVVDPGAEKYSFRTFSAQRYDSPLLNSLGHPVPRVAGRLQEAGGERRAWVREASFGEECDRVVLDLRGAYDVPELRRLERTFIFEREGDGALTIVDTVEFAEPLAFETALITFGEVELHRDGATIRQEGVALDLALMAGGTSLELVSERIEQEPHPTRIGLRCREPVKQASITQRFTPGAVTAAS